MYQTRKNQKKFFFHVLTFILLLNITFPEMDTEPEDTLNPPVLEDLSDGQPEFQPNSFNNPPKSDPNPDN